MVCYNYYVIIYTALFILRAMGYCSLLVCKITKYLRQFKTILNFATAAEDRAIRADILFATILYIMEELQHLYTEYFGTTPTSVQSLAGSGSARRYFRLTSDACSAVGVLGTDRRENLTFIYLDRLMRERGFAAPRILGVSADSMAYLQQDLGDTSLFDILHTPQGDTAVEEVMRTLPKLQFELKPDINRLYPEKEMTAQGALWDMQYFKYCFAKVAGAEMDQKALDREFDLLASRLWHGSCPNAIIYRDCQSRNVMIHESRPWWIDCQSIRRGPVLYDLASFLWQARAAFSREEREKFAGIYYDALKAYALLGYDEFRALLTEMALVRTLQVLGAYGLRGLTERKAHFLLSIPAALNNARELLGGATGERYPELKRLIERLAAMERFRHHDVGDRLCVTVFSFSYKQGYPEDLSGNGGGFMFDCRAMHNPGRYDRYKPLTGRDREVIDFLEERGEVQKFLKNAAALTLPAVDRYIKRGFSSLQIGFGCTGGRHRSVYCAEHLAHTIAERFAGQPLTVRLIHREQKIEETL